MCVSERERVCVCVRESVCVCVRERERERVERGVVSRALEVSGLPPYRIDARYLVLLKRKALC